MLLRILFGATMAVGASAQTQPTIAAVLNGASFNANSIGAGAFLTIMGSNLSPCTMLNSPMSTQVQCNDSLQTVVKVTANGAPLNLSYVSPARSTCLDPQPRVPTPSR